MVYDSVLAPVRFRVAPFFFALLSFYLLSYFSIFFSFPMWINQAAAYMTLVLVVLFGNLSVVSLGSDYIDVFCLFSSLFGR